MNISVILASLASWKTTAASVAVAAFAVGKLANDIASGTFDPSTLYADAAAISAAIGLFFAKDSNVTSAVSR